MRTDAAIKHSRGFTGWHMLGIMVAFFGTIIAANSLMAYYAGASWSGIIAKNTYVASQEFNIKAAEARAWQREGFKGRLSIEGSRLAYSLSGPKTEIDRLPSVQAIFHRPVGERQDFTVVLGKQSDGSFSATHDIPPGLWIIDVAATEKGKTVFHQAIRIHVTGGNP